jgi:hypothetical protein
MTGPQVGERWRYTRDVTITKILGPGSVRVRQDNLDHDRLIDLCTEVGTWERLPDPEPDWQVGDIALDADGHAWQRWPMDMWSVPGVMSGPRRLDSSMARPLTRLVPEVRP